MKLRCLVAETTPVYSDSSAAKNFSLENFSRKLVIDNFGTLMTSFIMCISIMEKSPGETKADSITSVTAL